MRTLWRMLGAGVGVALVLAGCAAAPVSETSAQDEKPVVLTTFTVLADHGYSDAEIVDWLFARGEDWPAGQSAMEAIGAGVKTEVRRRAMAAG